jgi:adenylate cyclase
VNLAARLCAQAGSGQILVDPKVWTEIQKLAEVEPAGEFLPKGFTRQVRTYNVVGLLGGSVHSPSN